MYAMHRGTARDVSFLIDFIPAYLFPEGEKTIEKFAMTGISLGGELFEYKMGERECLIDRISSQPSKATPHGSSCVMNLESL